MIDQIYNGAVKQNTKEKNRIAGAVNSNCPCFLYSNQAVPIFTKNSTARIRSSTGNTTLLTILSIWLLADVQVLSIALETSPLAKAVRLKQAAIAMIVVVKTSIRTIFFVFIIFVSFHLYISTLSRQSHCAFSFGE